MFTNSQLHSHPRDRDDLGSQPEDCSVINVPAGWQIQSSVVAAHTHTHTQFPEIELLSSN